MTDDIKQDRSPRSPGTALADALVQVDKLHKAIGRSKVPREVASQAIGYKGISGAALTALATLGQYGLIYSDAGKVGISTLAIGILFPRDEAHKLAGVRRAALSPKIFDKIRKEFDGCSKEVLTNQLVHEGFTPDRAELAARIYKANSEFAKLDDKGYIPQSEESVKQSDKLGNDVRNEDGTKNSPELPSPPGIRDFLFPLSNGTAAIRIPFPIEEEDFDFLLETLKLWRKKLVKQTPAQSDS